MHYVIHVEKQIAKVVYGSNEFVFHLIIAGATISEHYSRVLTWGLS